MMGSPGEIVVGGDLWLALPIALAAGLISFLSPCVLPLVPGYLGFVSGTAAATARSGTVEPTRTDGSVRRESSIRVGSARGAQVTSADRSMVGGASGESVPTRVAEARPRSRVALGSVLFVAGFTAVFLVIFGVAGVAGSFLLRWEDVLLRAGGAIVILMGLVFLGQVTFLQRTVKSSWQPRMGLAGAPLLGVVFAVGWTPCISPTLTAVAFLSGYGGDPGRALLVGLAYCVGLGIPFVLVALGFGWVGGSVRWVRRHIRAVNVAGGALLIVIGLLMVTGAWAAAMDALGEVIVGVQVPL